MFCAHYVVFKWCSKILQLMPKSAVHHAMIAFVQPMFHSCWLGMICCWGRQLTSLWNTCFASAVSRYPDSGAHSSSSSSAHLLRHQETCRFQICHTVMNWTLLVFGSVCLLVLGEDAFVQGKRDARTVTFSRTARGHSRRRRDTWTGQAPFTACKTQLSPKDQEILLSHTHEVRTRHWSSHNPNAVCFLCCFFFLLLTLRWMLKNCLIYLHTR